MYTHTCLLNELASKQHTTLKEKTMKDYILYNVIRKERFFYIAFATCEEALVHATCLAKKYGVSFELWKSNSMLFKIDANGIEVIF